jgi:class III poly(R)-hydroxyalkanoic acid synthase PhaE subunit
MGPEATNTGDWAAAMQKAQADLLRQWTEMGSAWAKATGSPAVPGAQPAAAAGAAADDVARRFLGQCEQYLGVSRSLWDLVGRAASSSDPEQRARVFTDGLGGLQQQFASLWVATPFGAPGGGAGAMGANPFAFGSGSVPGMSMPGMSMPNMAMPGFSATIPGMPALGPTRESQEAMQRLAQLGARYAQAQLQVSGQWNDIIGKSLRELGERLAPKLRSGAPPASMKEVYDLWVDSAETVYAQAARGAAFVQAQGELTNSMSQLRSAQRELLEEWAKQFDLPTRAELNSIHKQLRDLKAALQR